MIKIRYNRAWKLVKLSYFSDKGTSHPFVSKCVGQGTSIHLLKRSTTSEVIFHPSDFGSPSIKFMLMSSLIGMLLVVVVAVLLDK